MLRPPMIARSFLIACIFGSFLLFTSSETFAQARKVTAGDACHAAVSGAVEAKTSGPIRKTLAFLFKGKRAWITIGVPVVLTVAIADALVYQVAPASHPVRVEVGTVSPTFFGLMKLSQEPRARGQGGILPPVPGDLVDPELQEILLEHEVDLTAMTEGERAVWLQEMLRAAAVRAQVRLSEAYEASNAREE